VDLEAEALDGIARVTNGTVRPACELVRSGFDRGLAQSVVELPARNSPAEPWIGDTFEGPEQHPAPVWSDHFHVPDSKRARETIIKLKVLEYSHTARADEIPARLFSRKARLVYKGYPRPPASQYQSRHAARRSGSNDEGVIALCCHRLAILALE
jgi:hypothetical protein